MTAELGLLALGWLPVWIVALLIRQKLRPGRLLMGAALAAFVGGMCGVELRRHGLQADPAGAIHLPFLGLHVEEMLRYALLGASSSLLVEIALDRADREDSAWKGGLRGRRG